MKRDETGRRKVRTATGSAPRFHARWIAAGLFVAVALAYAPAWHGGLLWDDSAHITKPELRSLDGLWRIWFDLGATQQYYPLTHTAFWIQWQLWADAVLGYHLVSITLHALSAWLVFVLVRTLGLRGGVLAAFIFAVHPVHVESVAWITELKNTLSTPLALGSAIVFLRWRDEPHPRRYVAAFALFAAALLSKSVTATLPAALLVVFWWRDGRLGWRATVRPLVPFFAAGIAAGLFTAWVERTLIGAAGGEFALSAAERLLLAARVPWFYLGKLVWPANLSFIYPRWTIDIGSLEQWAFVLASPVAIALGWAIRSRTRAPLATALLFGGLLFPVLGFFNVFPFRYSFVADHFQYLASIPVIVFVSAVVAVRLAPRVAIACGVAATLGLGTVAWRQARDYASAETLYRATLARNPDAWLAHNNLALLLIDSGRAAEARAHLERAAGLNPRIPEHHANLGRLRLHAGDTRGALESFDAALAVDDGLANVHSDRGVALLRTGDIDAGIGALERARALDAALPEARTSLAEAYRERGIRRMQQRERAAAIEDFRRYGRLAPGDFGAAALLAQALHESAMAAHAAGRREEAVRQLLEAVALVPDNPLLRNDAGAALLDLGRRPEAAAQFEAALRIRPDFAAARENLARAR